MGFLREWNLEKANFDEKENVGGEVSEPDFA